jgi:hypothetical protein
MAYVPKILHDKYANSAENVNHLKSLWGEVEEVDEADEVDREEENVVEDEESKVAKKNKEKPTPKNVVKKKCETKKVSSSVAALKSSTKPLKVSKKEKKIAKVHPPSPQKSESDSEMPMDVVTNKKVSESKQKKKVHPPSPQQPEMQTDVVESGGVIGGVIPDDIPLETSNGKRKRYTPKRFLVEEEEPKPIRKVPAKTTEEIDIIGRQVNLPWTTWPDYTPTTSSEYKVKYYRAIVIDQFGKTSCTLDVYSNDPTKTKMLEVDLTLTYIQECMEKNPVGKTYTQTEWLTEFLANPLCGNIRA